MSLHIGCGGFPVARASYFRELGAVELRSTFRALPRPETAEAWRREAPAGFSFSLQAWHPVTHPAPGSRAGHFRASAEVDWAWGQTAETARILGARFVMFETPDSFYPNADHLRDMYAFFKRLRRREVSLVWQPRCRGWDPPLVRRVCQDLGLIHGVDPLAEAPQAGPVRYFRLCGGGPGRRASRGHPYADPELRAVLECCAGRPAFAFFLNADMWRDARRIRKLSEPCLPPRRTSYERIR